MSSSTSSYSSGERANISNANKKTMGKKKKKTVAHIIHLDNDDLASPPLRSRASSSTPPSAAMQHHRVSDPPSALHLPVIVSPDRTGSTESTSRQTSDIEHRQQSSKSSEIMRFVGGSSPGNILSPVTPVSTTLTSNGSDVPVVEYHDCDSSDALSVKSFGQVSLRLGQSF